MPASPNVKLFMQPCARHPGSWIGFDGVLMVGSLEDPSRAGCRAGAWHLPGTTTPQHSVSATTTPQHSVSAARLGRSCRVECQQDHVSHPLAREDVAADDSGVCRGTQQGACMAPRGVRYTGALAATTPWPVPRRAADTLGHAPTSVHTPRVRPGGHSPWGICTVIGAMQPWLRGMSRVTMHLMA
jgi:hypothetical protein